MTQISKYRTNYIHQISRFATFKRTVWKTKRYHLCVSRVVCVMWQRCYQLFILYVDLKIE